MGSVTWGVNLQWLSPRLFSQPFSVSLYGWISSPLSRKILRALCLPTIMALMALAFSGFFVALLQCTVLFSSPLLTLTLFSEYERDAFFRNNRFLGDGPKELLWLFKPMVGGEKGSVMSGVPTSHLPKATWVKETADQMQIVICLSVERTWCRVLQGTNRSWLHCHRVGEGSYVEIVFHFVLPRVLSGQWSGGDNCPHVRVLPCSRLHCSKLPVGTCLREAMVTRVKL